MQINKCRIHNKHPKVASRMANDKPIWTTWIYCEEGDCEEIFNTTFGIPQDENIIESLKKGIVIWNDKNPKETTDAN